MSQASDSPEAKSPNGKEDEEEESNGPNPGQEPEPVRDNFHHVESKEDMFEDAPDVIEEAPSIESELESPRGINEKEFKDESEVERGVVELHSKLKLLVGGNDDMVLRDDAPLSEMISECSEFVKLALEERGKSGSTVEELRREIEELNVKVSQLEEGFGVTADRMMGSLSMVVNVGELEDYSVSGKMDYVERSASLLVDQYGWFIYEVNQLRQCLYEGGFNVQEEVDYGSTFGIARSELVELKRKEGEMVGKLGYFEEESRKLVDELEKQKSTVGTVNAELERVQAELEQEKNRCANTKEKLSMAVTKGKALVQQRDALKQSLAEKTRELEKCFADLQEKSSVVEAADLCKGELIKCESLVTSLQEAVSQRDAVLESFEQVFSQISVPEELQSVDIIERLKWLVSTVGSLQEALSQKNVIFEHFEDLMSQTSIPKELQSTDVIERLKWLVNLVASLQETHSQRNKTFVDLEDIFSEINVPAELQLTDVVERLKWLVEERDALKGNLLEFHKLKDALSMVDIPETVSSSDLESRIGWLRDSVNQARDEIRTLQFDIAKSKEAAAIEIERLSASLSAELQEKEYIKTELDELARNHEVIVKKAHQVSSEKEQIVTMLLESSGMTMNGLEEHNASYSDIGVLINRCFGRIKDQTNKPSDTSADTELLEKLQGLLYVSDQELVLCENLLEEDMVIRSHVDILSNDLRVTSLELAALKDEKDSLQRNLERSEEKSSLLREKLSLAVKKGKGLVQDRENMKLILDEKNSEIQKLKLELEQQECGVAECNDKINTLSTDLEQIPKLKEDLVTMTEQRDQLEQFLSGSNDTLQSVMKSIDHIVLPVDLTFEQPIEKVNWISQYMNECQQAKSHTEQELWKVKEETSMLASELAAAQKTITSLEDALTLTEKNMSQLSEEGKELEFLKRNAEENLQRAMDETVAQTSKLDEASTLRKSLENALSMAENNISQHIKEKEEAQLSVASAETELEKVRDEAAIQTTRLTEAYRTIKSLEDALSQAERNVALLSEQNSLIQVGRTNLDDEVKKLLYEVESQAGKLTEASSTINSLEGALSKAMNDVSVLRDEKRIFEQEISTLNSKLNTCMDELSGTNGHLESSSVELMHHLSDLQKLMGNESLLSMVRQSFHKQFKNLENMDLVLKDIRDHAVASASEFQQSLPELEVDEHVRKQFPQDLGSMGNSEMHNGELNTEDANSVSLYFKKTVDEFQMKNKIFGDSCEGFFTFIDEVTGALLGKLKATKDTVMVITKEMQMMKQKMKNTETREEEQERTIVALENNCRVLLSACTSATSELQLEVKNNLLELCPIPEFEKLNHGLIPEVTQVDDADGIEHKQWHNDSKYANTARNLLMATRKVQTLVKLFESTSNTAASTIEDLQTKLMEARATSLKAMEEKELMQNKVLRLETDLETSQNSYEEIRLKVQEHEVIEEKLKEKEEELSTLHGQFLMKEKEAEDSLMLASQLKILSDKARRVDFSFPESGTRDLEPHCSADVKKLFHIIDSVTELQHEKDGLFYEKQQLESTLATNILEIEHLREEIEAHIRDERDLEKTKAEISELMFSFEKIIGLLGIGVTAGDQKSDLQRLLQASEKRIMALLLEAENSKSQAQERDMKLLANQKVIDDLSAKLKLLGDSSPSRSTQPEIVQERSIFEAPALSSGSAGSEISEIEDGGSIGKNTTATAPSAAHVRTMRKGSTDHLALNIDLESGSLISSEEADDDKGHVFKSLNTSGLIPKQGKSLADRVDGIWVSGGRVLMSRPRARLSLIAYCLVLHLWLLATIL